MVWTPEEQTWLENSRSVLESNNLDRIASRLREIAGYHNRLKMTWVLSAIYDAPIFINNLGYIKSVTALFGTTEVSLGNISDKETDPTRLFESYKEFYGLPGSWKIEDLEWDNGTLIDEFWHIVKN